MSIQPPSSTLCSPQLLLSIFYNFSNLFIIFGTNRKSMKTHITIGLLIIGQAINVQEIANRIPFLNGDKWGYANSGGELMIAAEFDEAYPFYEGAAKVMKNGFYGLIDEDGDEMVKPIYKYASNFHDGYAAVKVRDKYGFINKDGKMIIPTKAVPYTKKTS